MTTAYLVPLVLAGVLTVYLWIAVRTWTRVRGARVVVCPDTRRPAAVRVDIGHAIATAIWEKPDVRLTACSRWPDGRECDQPCASQIERTSSATQPKAMAARFFAGRRCAICQRSIDPLSVVTLQPGFMDPDTRQVQAWNEVAPQALPATIAASRALCSNCTLAESFRQRIPDRVVDRRPH